MSEQKEEITLALIGQKLDSLQETVNGHIKEMKKKIFFYDKMQIEFGIFKWIAGTCAFAIILQIVIAVSKHVFRGG
jgi:hypothetical protein